MTGFLGERNAPGARDLAQNLEAWKGLQPGFFESMGARGTAAAVTEDYFGLTNRRLMAVLEPVSEQLYGDPQAWRIYADHRRAGVPSERIATTPGVAAAMPFDEALTALFADLEKARAQNPEAWASAPKDRAALEAEVREQLKRERADAERVVGRERDLPWVPDQTLKSIAAEGFIGATQPEALPLFAFGGGAATLAGRVAVNAGLGAAGEVLTRPRIERQAEFLGEKPSDFLTDVTVAAAFGGALPLAGAAFRGGRQMMTAEGRAETFGNWRDAALANAEDRISLRQAEEALVTGRPTALPETPPPPPPKPQATDEWIEAIIWQESKGQADALSPKGARGIMQVMPATARDPGYGVRGMTGTDEEILAQLADPAKNREFGKAYFQGMLNKYENYEDALAAYNWGPDSMDKWIAAGRPSASMPKETRDYVRIVTRRARTQDQAAPSAPLDWSRPEPSANAGGVYMPPNMTTPTGAKIGVRYEMVDLAQLRSASGDLQPRDRTRIGSREQIATMAADLDPDQLMPSPSTAIGAPLIGPDDIVESGNGRIAALRLAAEMPDTGRYAAYLDQLRDLGFDVPATGQPVLVARRMTEMDEAARHSFTTDANAPVGMRFSPTEQARIDAEAVPMEALAQFESGAQIFSREGRAFVQSMFAHMPQTDRAALYTHRGGLSAAGRLRIETAIFARAYEAPHLIDALAETPSDASAGMVRALTEAAPQWASLRHEIAEGRIDARFDLTPDLAEAVRVVAGARRDAAAQKRPVATVLDDALRQSDLVTGPRSPAQQMLARAFFNDGRPRAAEKTAEILKGYVAAARRGGDTGPDLFGDRPSGSPLEALSAGARRAGEDAEPSTRGKEPSPEPEDGLGQLVEEPPARPPVEAAEAPPPQAVPTPDAALRQPEALTRYSDPAGAESRAADDAHARELRERLLADPDLAATPLVDAEGAPLLGADGSPQTFASLLADIDADADLAQAVKYCGRTRG